MNTLLQKVREFFTDKNGKVVIGQFPNAPLAVWLVCYVLVFFIPDGTPATIIQYVGRLALAVWAILEIRSGVDTFRRVLGGLVLASLVIGLLL